jgi:V/A-type H+/Na+-transporting ATPase subunit K
MSIFIIATVLVALLFLPLFIRYRAMSKGKQIGSNKRAVLINLSAFAVICLIGVIFPIGGLISAATTTTATTLTVGQGLGYLASALAIGISCVGGGIAVAQGSAAAIGAITEDPKVFGRAMIFVVLGEGIAIYGLIISFLIYAKV